MHTTTSNRLVFTLQCSFETRFREPGDPDDPPRLGIRRSRSHDLAADPVKKRGVPPELAARRSRERRIAIMVTLLLFLLVEIPALLISGAAARRSSIAVASESLSRVGDATVESVLRYLAPAERSAGILSEALVPEVADVRSPMLERLLRAQVVTASQVESAFVGFPDGSVLLVGREAGGYRVRRIINGPSRTVVETHTDLAFRTLRTETIKGDTYDPRVRPWYVLAKDSGRTEWTDPYVFFSPQRPGVTAARAVVRDGRLIGVVGMDVQLAGLSSFLGNLAFARTGEAFVVTDDRVVAAPDKFAVTPTTAPDGTLQLPTVAEFGVPALSVGETTRARAVDAGDARDLVVRRSFNTPSLSQWQLVVSARESEFTTSISSQQRTLLLLSLIGGLVVLGAVLFGLMRVMRPIAALRSEASTDALTGLHNRRGLAEAGERLVEAARRDDALVGVLAFDLDRFKAVNDHHGHAAGDRVLVAFADHLSAHVGERAVIARPGGDEFIVVQRFDDAASARTLAEVILMDAHVEFVRDGRVGEIRASAGLALSSDIDGELAELLQAADEALIEVKKRERGTLGVATSYVT